MFFLSSKTPITLPTPTGCLHWGMAFISIFAMLILYCCVPEPLPPVTCTTYIDFPPIAPGEKSYYETTCIAGSKGVRLSYYPKVEDLYFFQIVYLENSPIGIVLSNNDNCWHDPQPTNFVLTINQ